MAEESTLSKWFSIATDKVTDYGTEFLDKWLSKQTGIAQTQIHPEMALQLQTPAGNMLSGDSTGALPAGPGDPTKTANMLQWAALGVGGFLLAVMVAKNI